jgi:hypothetical protein
VSEDGGVEKTRLRLPLWEATVATRAYGELNTFFPLLDEGKLNFVTGINQRTSFLTSIVA